MRPTALLQVSILLVAVTSSSFAKKKEAARHFSICHRKDPELDKCIQKSIMSSTWIPGISEIRLRPSDPMFVPLMDMKDANFHAKLENVTFVGFKKLSVSQLRTNFKNPKAVTIDVTLDVPKLDLSGMYEMGGRIMVIPIKGKGDFTMNFKNAKLKIAMKGEIVQIKGQDHLQIKGTTMDTSITGGGVRLNNLFNNDKTLSDGTHKFLNENFKDVYESLKQLPEGALSEIAKDISNRVFGGYPLDELLPQ